jgi:hypothetical protein
MLNVNQRKASYMFASVTISGNSLLSRISGTDLEITQTTISITRSTHPATVNIVMAILPLMRNSNS